MKKTACGRSITGLSGGARRISAPNGPSRQEPRVIVPRVCISVLNWNGAERTLICLDALTHLDYPEPRIIVVDNASTDGSVSRIAAAYPNLEIVRADSNGGYAAGN